MAGRYALLSRDLYSNQKTKGPYGRWKRRGLKWERKEFGKTTSVHTWKCFERCQQVRGAGAGMFARWAECSPTSFSSPLERNPCPPQQENVCACTEAQRLSRSSLASKLQVLALRLLVAKDESFAFGSASSVGRPGQPSPSELVDGFDDSTVNIKERRARGRGGSPRPDHPIRSDDPGMVQ